MEPSTSRIGGVELDILAVPVMKDGSESEIVDICGLFGGG